MQLVPGRDSEVGVHVLAWMGVISVQHCRTNDRHAFSPWGAVLLPSRPTVSWAADWMCVWVLRQHWCQTSTAFRTLVYSHDQLLLYLQRQQLIIRLAVLLCDGVAVGGLCAARIPCVSTGCGMT